MVTMRHEAPTPPVLENQRRHGVYSLFFCFVLFCFVLFCFVLFLKVCSL
jgi:hypothetical protein